VFPTDIQEGVKKAVFPTIKRKLKKLGCNVILYRHSISKLLNEMKIVIEYLCESKELKKIGEPIP
jgi:hypothetical protein